VLYALIRVVVAIGFSIFRVLYGVRIEGLENLPAEGPFILSSNEIGKLGNMLISFVVAQQVLGGHMPRPIGFLDEYSLETQYGALFREVGTLPLFPHGQGLGVPALLKALQFLRQGKVLAFNPEAAISIDGRLVSLTRGVSWLGLRSGAPIVLMVATKGAYDAWPVWAAHPQMSGRFQVRIGKPLYLNDGPCSQVSDIVLDRANERLAEEMRSLIYH
jgi:1-acyl-sn-glycerol-3-phosphate acyltransferase